MPWLRRLVAAVVFVATAAALPGMVAARQSTAAELLLDEVGSGLERGADTGSDRALTRRFQSSEATLDLQVIPIESGFDVAALYRSLLGPAGASGLAPFPEPSLALGSWMVEEGQRPEDVSGGMLVFASSKAIFIAILDVDPASSMETVPFLTDVARRQVERAGGSPPDEGESDLEVDEALAALLPERAGGLALVGTFAPGPDAPSEVDTVTEVERYLSDSTGTAVRIWSSEDGTVVAAASISDYPLALFAAASLGTYGRTSTTELIVEPSITAVPGAVAYRGLGTDFEQIGAALRRGSYSASVLVSYRGPADRDAVVAVVAAMAGEFAVRLPDGASSAYRFPGTPSKFVAAGLSAALVTLAAGGSIGVGRARARQLRRRIGTTRPRPVGGITAEGVVPLDDDARRLRRRARVVLAGQLTSLAIGVGALAGDFAWTGVVVAGCSLVAGVLFTTWWSRRERALLGPVAPRIDRILPRPGGALLGVLALAVLGLGAGFGLKGLRYLVLKPTLAHVRWADLLGTSLRGVGIIFVTGGVAACMAGASLFRLARAWSRADSRRLLLADPRPPVLYLRAFEDDRLPLASIVTARRPMLELFSLRGADPFEEAIAAELDTYGPVIAIGRPGRSLASLGAAREHLPDATWQEQVAERMAGASTVVVAIGRSDGLHWEINRIVEAGHLAKAMFVVPPLAPHVLEERWRFTVEALRRAGAAVADLPVPVADVHTVQVATDGRLRVTTAAFRDEASYRSAIDRALGEPVPSHAVSAEGSAEDELGHRPQGVG